MGKVFLMPIPANPVKAARGLLKGGKASTETLLKHRKMDKMLK